MDPFAHTPPMRLLSLLTLFLALVSCDSRSDVEIANEEGILIIGNSNEPKGLDPHLVSGVLESNIIRALFEGLCVEHPEKDAVALPGAAERWEANEEFTQWTFYLNPKAKWSDGVPVTAHDFVFSYRRLLSPDPNWPAEYAEMLYFLENAEAFHQYKRGYILFGINTDPALPWEKLEDINFRGLPELSPTPFVGLRIAQIPSKDQKPFLNFVNQDANIDFNKLDEEEFKDLNTKERILRINFKGLDKCGEAELSHIQSHPESFTWPESIEKNSRAIIIDRLLAQTKAGFEDLWNKANVGVHAIDDFTLKLDLRGPVPFLPELTKHYTWYPVPKHTILDFGEINTAFASQWTRPGNLVSNGPFKLKIWETNHLIEVERNPYYWDNKNVSLNGIRYLPISNYYTETRMFSDDQLHLTYTVPAELIPYAKEHFPEKLRQEPYVGVRFLRSNTLRPPFDNPKVRRAFALSIDQQAICDKILQGGQKPASGIVPPFGSYTPPGIIHYDPELAKKLLAESGYASASGFPDISLLTTDTDSGRREAEALQAMWQQNLGIKVRIVQREWTNYLQKQYTADFDLAANGWIGDYLDPTTFLEMWTAGNGNNNTGWASPEFEKLLNKAENTADVAQRMAILSHAETILLEDTPVMPIYWYTTNYLIRPEVKKWSPLLLNNHPFKFVELKP